MAGPFSGVGTVIRRWDSGSSGWVNLTEVKSIDGPNMTRETYDTTSLDTVAGYRTFIGGFRDGGTVGLEANFTRAGYDIAKADFENDDLQNYEIVLPDDDATSFEFEGLISELGTAIPNDNIVSAAVSIKVSGEVTINSGSASADPT
jgi:predicted secreted protein